MKNKKSNDNTKIIIFMFLFSVISLCALVITLKDKDKVCFEQTCFKVEKAESLEERTVGLMYRDSLAENKGMLFIFENESIYSFWMKNTLIPLDMIWINSSEQVAYVYSNANPCKEICPPIIPKGKANYVLEINAGLADKYSIKQGDEVKIY